MTRYDMIRAALAVFTTLFLSVTAEAQLFRAYLASDGSDANPCTLAAPAGCCLPPSRRWRAGARSGCSIRPTTTPGR
jgi:hypothetical protein